MPWFYKLYTIVQRMIRKASYKTVFHQIELNSKLVVELSVMLGLSLGTRVPELTTSL